MTVRLDRDTGTSTDVNFTKRSFAMQSYGRSKETINFDRLSVEPGCSELTTEAEFEAPGGRLG